MKAGLIFLALFLAVNVFSQSTTLGRNENTYKAYDPYRIMSADTLAETAFTSFIYSLDKQKLIENRKLYDNQHIDYNDFCIIINHNDTATPYYFNLEDLQEIQKMKRQAKNALLVSLEDHNSNAKYFYCQLGKPVKNGIACPKCGAELYDSNPFIILTSFPPQLEVHCEKCDYTGYRIKRP